MNFPGKHIFLILICALLVACGSSEERAINALQQAQVHFDAGEFTAARQQTQRALELDSGNADVRYLLALIDGEDRQIRKMASGLRDVIKLDKNHINARVRLGNLYFIAQSFGLASKEADAAMSIAPDNASVRALYAKILAEQGETEKALQEIEIALELDPANLDVVLVKTGLYLADGKRQEAIEILGDAVTRFDREAGRRLRMLQMILLAEDRRAEELEDVYLSSVEDFPEEEGFSLGLAGLYAEQGRKAEAGTVLRRLISLQPDNVNARVSLASTFAGLRDQDAAESILLEFLAESPDDIDLKMALAQLYEANDKQAEAYARYEEIAAFNPLVSEGLFARGRLIAILIDQQDLQTAREFADDVLRDVPTNFDALIYRAGLNMFDGLYDEAIVDLRLGLREKPKSTRALYLLGSAYKLRGDWILAMDAYRELLMIQPDHRKGLRELGKVLAAREDTSEETVVVSREELTADDDYIETRSDLIEALLETPRLAAAEAEAKRMEQLEPDNNLGDYDLGRTLLAQGRFTEAEAAYRRVLQKEPGKPQAIQSLVDTLVADGREQEALDYVMAQLTQYPERSTIRLILADLLVESEAKGVAKQLYETILEDNPKIVEAYLGLGYVQIGDPPGQIETYQTGLLALPDDPQLLGGLSEAYKDNGQIDEAIKQYEYLLDRHPDNLAANNNFAALLLDYRQDQDSHLRALRMAIQFEDLEEPIFLDTLGWAYYRLAEFNLAVQVLERAVETESAIPVLRYHLGMAYLASDKPVDARLELREAIIMAETKFTGFDEARNALAKLRADST